LEKGLEGMRHPAPNVYGGGQPTAEDLAEAKALGVGVIVNLRLLDEPGVLENERAIVESLGMRYVSLPTVKPGGEVPDQLTVEQAQALANAMGDDIALVHCGSGNRVGALLGLKARVVDGATVEEALTFGIAAGVEKPNVKALLEERLRAAPVIEKQP